MATVTLLDRIQMQVHVEPVTLDADAGRSAAAKEVDFARAVRSASQALTRLWNRSPIQKSEGAWTTLVLAPPTRNAPLPAGLLGERSTFRFLPFDGVDGSFLLRLVGNLTLNPTTAMNLAAPAPARQRSLDGAHNLLPVMAAAAAAVCREQQLDLVTSAVGAVCDALDRALGSVVEEAGGGLVDVQVRVLQAELYTDVRWAQAVESVGRLARRPPRLGGVRKVTLLSNPDGTPNPVVTLEAGSDRRLKTYAKGQDVVRAELVLESGDAFRGAAGARLEREPDLDGARPWVELCDLRAQLRSAAVAAEGDVGEGVAALEELSTEQRPATDLLAGLAPALAALDGRRPWVGKRPSGQSLAALERCLLLLLEQGFCDASPKGEGRWAAEQLEKLCLGDDAVLARLADDRRGYRVRPEFEDAREAARGWLGGLGG